LNEKPKSFTFDYSYWSHNEVKQITFFYYLTMSWGLTTFSKRGTECAREHSQKLVGGADDVLCFKKFFDPYLIYLRTVFKKSKNLRQFLTPPLSLLHIRAFTLLGMFYKIIFSYFSLKVLGKPSWGHLDFLTFTFYLLSF